MLRNFRISSMYMPSGILALSLLVPLGSAHARWGETVLYAFTGGSDGSLANPGLTMNSAGDLYGTTYEGGKNEGGVVFKVAPDGTERVLYRFCSQANCTDGQNPLDGVITDGSGNLYGTTTFGGANGTSQTGGVVFKLARDGTETVLHSFCSKANCADGNFPYAGMIRDSAGNLYGTTISGGDNCSLGCGTVFKVAPDGTETVLYAFCARTNCTDGQSPQSRLVMDSAGNLYGTTDYGGTNCTSYGGCGTVFKVTPDGTETVLYSFCSRANCSDGQVPYGGVISDNAGNFYGTTYFGGSTSCSGGCGTVFELAPDGTETVLHAFTGKPDGAQPSGGLIRGYGGNLYGATEWGGKKDSGAIFKIFTAGGTERVLYSFNFPFGSIGPSVTLKKSGALYGTTHLGSSGEGAVFELAK